MAKYHLFLLIFHLLKNHFEIIKIFKHYCNFKLIISLGKKSNILHFNEFVDYSLVYFGSKLLCLLW